MASEHTVQPEWFIRSQFKKHLRVLFNRFHDLMLFYTQDIQVVNFSQINKGLVHVCITYITAEGRLVTLEAEGTIGSDYMNTLEFIWQAMKRAILETPADYSGPFSLLTLPLPD